MLTFFDSRKPGHVPCCLGSSAVGQAGEVARPKPARRPPACLSVCLTLMLHSIPFGRLHIKGEVPETDRGRTLPDIQSQEHSSALSAAAPDSRWQLRGTGESPAERTGWRHAASLVTYNSVSGPDSSPTFTSSLIHTFIKY